MLETPCEHLLPACLLNLQLYIRLHLAIHDMLLARHFAVVGRFLVTYVVLLQVPVRASRLDLQLDGTTPLHQAEDEASLVHRIPDTQQSVVHQYGALVMLPQRFRNPLTLFASKDDAAVRSIDCVAIVQAAHVLRDHLQRPGENTPRPSCVRVRVTHSVNIRAALVNLGVDVIARLVSCDGPRPWVGTPADNATGLDFHRDHVAGCECAVVPRERIHPHDLGELWVANRDVPGLAFGIAHAGPVAEDSSHVNEDMPPFGSVGWERGDI